MREFFRYGITLSLICAIASGLLAGVNAITQPRIITQRQTEEKATLKQLFPAASNFKAVRAEKEIAYYRAYNKSNKVIGYAFKAAKRGYASTIETMVGMDTNGEIVGIKILSQNETPGLGSQVAEPNFEKQFSQKKDLNKVEAISGATISSRAVIDSIKEKTNQIRYLIKHEK